MSDSTGEKVPGDTLRQLIEEHDQIQEFKRAMRERVDLERDHLVNMEKQQRTLHAKINQSSIWTLVSPLMDYFETEIQHRRDACDSLVGQLDAIPEPDHPNRIIQDGVSPLDWYEQLEEANTQHSKCYEVSRSPESISSLVEWFQRRRPEKRLRELTDAEIMTYEIPKIDQDYRRSVLYQNRVSTEMRQWHEQQLKTCLDAHQQQAEDINIFLRQIVETHNNLCLTLVKSCSATQLAISRFSSVRFIGTAHDGQREESLHPYFTGVAYFNFALYGRSSFGFYGTDEALNFLWEKWTDYFRYESFWNVSSPDIRGRIEDEEVLFKSPVVGSWTIRYMIMFAFLSMPPILPLTDEDMKRFAKGIPRSKMSSFMRRFPISQRTKLWKHLQQMKKTDDTVLTTILLTHRSSATRIVEDIWAKWDFNHNDALPAKTIRVGAGPDRFQNTATGEIYYKE